MSELFDNLDLLMDDMPNFMGCGLSHCIAVREAGMSLTDRFDRSQGSMRAGRGVLHALSALAPLGAVAGDVDLPVESYMQKLKKAVLSVSSADLFEVSNKMRAARVSGAVIAQSYVPAVARWLGDAWLEDEVKFTTVTMACARLQALVRRLDGAWGDMHEVAFSKPPVFLVGIPEGVQHSLGASILAGHLRSRGYTVLVDFELSPNGSAEKLRPLPLSGVFLSISDAGKLDCFNALIQSIQEASPEVPVILGGALLAQETDISALNNADLITCDIDKALRFCRVSVENEVDMIALETKPRIRSFQVVGQDGDIR